MKRHFSTGNSEWQSGYLFVKEKVSNEGLDSFSHNCLMIFFYLFNSMEYHSCSIYLHSYEYESKEGPLEWNLILIGFFFIPAGSSCRGPGMVPCSVDPNATDIQECVHQRQICNKVEDCSNAEDERDCGKLGTSNIPVFLSTIISYIFYVFLGIFFRWDFLTSRALNNSSLWTHKIKFHIISDE